MNTNCDHPVEKWNWRPNMRDTQFLRPRPPARQIGPFPDSNDAVLVPGYLPIRIRAFVEQERTNGETFLAQERCYPFSNGQGPVSYTHLRAHETDSYLVCRLLLE